MSLTSTITGVSVWAPGLDGWEASRPILAGDALYVPTPLAPPPPPLPPAERRRCGPVVRLALAAATEAAPHPPTSMHAIFASSTGDGPVVGAILAALAQPGDERVVSPTQFHNSVHNAAAGYWSIAHATTAPATSIGCHDDTFAAGLLAAMAERHTTGGPVLLCCYDYPLPPPLDAVRPIGPGFAAALLLAGGPGPTLTLALSPVPCAPPPPFAEFARNPAARALPLLAALARCQATSIHLPYLGGSIALTLAP